MLSVDELSRSEDAAIKNTYERVASTTDVKEVPLAVWLDDQGRARRLALLMPVGIPEDATEEQRAALSDARLKYIEEFYDFGVDVAVEAPPEDRVVDAPSPPAEAAPGAPAEEGDPV